uniref:Uncharacterized protein n=1 Tax=Anguilla anguilla TaxID=7936 RepID=A0A0E9PB25_ANGAN
MSATKDNRQSQPFKRRMDHKEQHTDSTARQSHSTSHTISLITQKHMRGDIVTLPSDFYDILLSPRWVKAASKSTVKISFMPIAGRITRNKQTLPKLT